MMPPKLQLLAVVAFAVAMLFLENQIQKLEESRSKLGEELNCFELSAVEGAEEALPPELAGVRLIWGLARGLKQVSKRTGNERQREHELQEWGELSMSGMLDSRGHGAEVARLGFPSQRGAPK
ncbi:hypothetical protein P7K49_016596 [Saguinus oedipus]|uniref:Uncharacterized protein n=1 Tax=Saguinus oedipus TaxID=9490 RepID=A0ABQ9VCZ1_SAGOE|nr:hypothetical protein P7K49_016596 [Saguinus oedipus]